VIDGVMRVQGHATSNPTSFAMVGALEALRCCEEEVQKMIAEYAARREMLIPRLNEIPGVQFRPPLGAFYAFPSVARFGITSKDFALELLRQEKVAVVPGTAFGACGEGFVRCAYATSLESLKEAMLRMQRFIGRL
jgi:aminotransferase